MATIQTRDPEFANHIDALVDSYTAPALPNMLNPLELAVATATSIYDVLRTPGAGFVARAFKGVVAL